MKVLFNRPFLTGKEIEYIRDLLASLETGGSIAGNGAYTKKVQALIESRFRVHKSLLTTSCTGALELATDLIGLKPGDQVIVPSFTFPSTANPILMAGAFPVFTDISPETLTIDPDKVSAAVTPSTRAVYPVHYAGVSCLMDEIMEIADTHALKVVEDAAQGVNARYRGRYLGTIGDFGCYSFHETKNYSCGEGGALLINTDDREIINRAEVIWEKGTDRIRFHRGEVDKYTWRDIGSSYLPSDILAAFLLAQLEEVDRIQELRMQAWEAYRNGLRPLEKEGYVRLPVVPEYVDHNAHLFYLLVQDNNTRDLILDRLKYSGVHAVFHYIPLHLSPMGRNLGYRPGDLPITEDLASRLIRLPLYAGISPEEVAFVIRCVEEAFSGV